MREFRTYSRDEVDALVKCYRRAFMTRFGRDDDGDADYYRDEVRELLGAMTQAGITVSFPEPRFYVEDQPSGAAMGTRAWHIFDRESERCVAEVSLDLLPGATGRLEALALADRLNGENPS